jgi:hypothetical protein
MIEEYLSENSQVIVDKYFVRFTKSLRLFLVLSRLPYLKNNGAFLFFLQKVMTVRLSKLHQAIEKGTTIYKSTHNDSIKRRISVHKHISRIIQMIADGIAWRNIGFNRPLMRLLSDKPSPGHIDEKELKNILSVPRYRGEIFIINDLTRFCRIGDFTVVTKDHRIILYEMKSRKSKIIKLLDVQSISEKLKKNNKTQLTKQELRHVLAQDAIITNKITIPVFDENQKVVNELKIDILNIDVDIPNVFSSIKKLIQKAEQTSFAASEVEDGLFIEVWDFKKMLSLSLSGNSKNDPIEKIKKIRTPLLPNWFEDKKNILSYYTSLSLIEENNQFPRNIIPYSVLLFSSRTCLRIMIGEIDVRVFYYLPNLKKILESQGWIVEEIDWEKEFANKVEKISASSAIFNNGSDQAIFKVKKHLFGGIFYSEILLTELLQIVSSFYSPFLVLKSLDFKLKQREQAGGSALITANYTKEGNILK